MPDPRQFDPDRVRMVLDHGEMVELDGGTLAVDGAESPSVVLRLAPGVPGQSPECCKSGRQCHESSASRLDRSLTSWLCCGHCSWPLRHSATAKSRPCGRLAVHALSLTGSAWPPWQS